MVSARNQKPEQNQTAELELCSGEKPVVIGRSQEFRGGQGLEWSRQGIEQGLNTKLVWKSCRCGTHQAATIVT